MSKASPTCPRQIIRVYYGGGKRHRIFVTTVLSTYIWWLTRLRKCRPWIINTIYAGHSLNLRTEMAPIAVLMDMLVLSLAEVCYIAGCFLLMEYHVRRCRLNCWNFRRSTCCQGGQICSTCPSSLECRSTKRGFTSPWMANTALHSITDRECLHNYL